MNRRNYLTPLQKLQYKFDLPQIVVVYGQTNDNRFQYTITDELWKLIVENNRLHQLAPFDRNEKFDPRHSIDDFLFFFTRSEDYDYAKRYNVDIIGALTVEYSVGHTEDEDFLLLDIRLSFPKEILLFSDVSKFLKYAVGDNYVGLARKLSIFPPSFEQDALSFCGVRVFLESETNALTLPGNDFVFFEYWANYHKHFSPHFIVTGNNSFASADPLPFPLNTIAEADEEVPDDEFVPLNIPVPINVIADAAMMAADAGEIV